MIVVTLKGGLGNQLFQYAAARALGLKHNTSLCIDHSFLEADPKGQWTARKYRLDVFPALADLKRYSFAGKVAGKLSSRPRFAEQGTVYNAAFEELGSDVHLDGYFQSERYFSAYAGEVRSDFSFPALKAEYSNNLAPETAFFDNRVSVHIRRGDMASLQQANEFHGTLSPDYYHTAMEHLQKNVAHDLCFCVFSDDMDWVRANIQFPGDVLFVDWNQGNEIEDMHLMSLCTHHIIANSSFSWWGAWLSTREGKQVIAPQRWFRSSLQDSDHIVPKDWLRL